MRVRPVAIALGAALGLSSLAAVAPPAGAHDLPRIRIAAPPGHSLLVRGTYPPVQSPCLDPVQPLLSARYRGAIEVGLDDDGSLFLVGELSFEDYLKGIAEVPRSWPMEALKAQAVAARTFALSRLARPTGSAEHYGYDLCATDACQVYRGMGVEEGPWGKRWAEAVRATRGEALLYAGRPAETLYFSTSNGQTLGNDEVFGTDPLPYLRPVEERDDGASPLSRWSVALPLDDLSVFLRDAGLWSGRDVRRVTQRGDRVVLERGQSTVVLDRSEFRSALNASAPCLDPVHYPAGELPQTIPSRWFDLETAGGSVLVEGRGWGHGVGMVQWGAYGKALRGLSYRAILAYYYGGLRPVPYREPKTIRVGIATGLESVTIVPSGPAEVSGRRLGSGPWVFTGGERLRARPADAPRPLLAVRGFEVQQRAEAGAVIRASLEVDGAAKARLVLLVEGEEVPLSPFKPFLEGPVALTGRLPELPPGRYRIHAVITDGIEEVRTEARPIRVAGPAPASPSPGEASPSPTGAASRAVPPEAPSEGWPASRVAALAAGVIVAAAGLALATRRTRRHARGSGSPGGPGRSVC